MNTLEFFKNERDVRHFKGGERIFSEGDPGDVFFAVLDGEVAIERHGKQVDRVKPGEIFGEMALIDDAPRSAAAVAITDTHVAVVGRSRFTFLVQQTPFFALHVMHILAERLRRDHET